jgi:hypothetical protein
MSASTRYRQCKFTAGLPRHHLCDCMSDGHPSLLGLLLRQASSDAHFQRRLQLPALFLRGAVRCDWHAFEPRNQYPIRQYLTAVSLNP